MQQLQRAHAQGGWVLLQNIHLTMDWTAGALEKAVDNLAHGAHPDFRPASIPLSLLAVQDRDVDNVVVCAAGCSCQRRHPQFWSGPSP